LGGVISLAIALLLGIFAEPILKIAGSKGEVLVYGARFMKVASIGIFFNMLTGMLNAGLRGTGNTVFPLMISVVINIITISLDWILIFGRFGIRPLGIMGSAIATTTAYIICFIAIIMYYKYFSDFKPRLRYMKKINKHEIMTIVRLAIPSGLQEGAFSTSRLVSLSFIMHLGTVAFAANQITTTIESISFMPGWGFAVAATALVGQRIGAKDYKTAREYAYISTLFGVGIMLVCSVLFISIPEFLMGLFIKESETIELGRLCLMVAAIEQPFMALSMVLGGALKGAGDTKVPFIVAFISSWVIRVPLIYYVIFIAKMNVVYVWGATAVQWAFEGLTLLYLFNRKSKRWKE
jgi:MATE family multidrug resistance protein